MYTHLYILKKEIFRKSSCLSSRSSWGYGHLPPYPNMIFVFLCCFLLTHIEMQLRVGVWLGDSRDLAFTALRPESTQQLLATSMACRVLVCSSFPQHTQIPWHLPKDTQPEGGEGRRIGVGWGGGIACLSNWHWDAGGRRIRSSVILSYIAHTGQPGIHETLCLKRL